MCRTKAWILFLSLALIAVSGCKKDDENESDENPIQGNLLLEASSLYTIANGISKVEIDVFEVSQTTGKNPVSAEVFVNDSLVSTDGQYTFITNEVGFFRIKASAGGKFSDTGITSRPTLSLDTLYIPIVFHLIKDATGAISRQSLEEPGSLEALLKEANAIINPDTDRLNSIEDNGNWQTANIKLVPATHDPDGNPLPIPGLHIYEAPQDTLYLSFNNTDWMWDTYWHPDHYFNAWVGNLENPRYGGQGTYPWFEPGVPTYEGAQIRQKADSPDYLTGITLERVDEGILIHELGHYIGLPHVFNHICDTDSDFCADTPNYVRVGFGNLSGTYRQGCNGIVFQANNHMDYGPRAHLFTYDQVKRMRIGLEYGTYRPFTSLRNGGEANLERSNRVPKVTKPETIVQAQVDY